MKKFHYVICLALLLASFKAMGSDSKFGDIEAKYRSIDDLEAKFTQTTAIEVLGKSVSETGVFMMKKTGMLRIDYNGQNPKQYISNGKKLWVIDEELKQVETYKVSSDSIPKEALEFLKGFSDMQKLFVVNGWKPKGMNHSNSYLRLVPKNGKAQYNWLDCEFGPDNLLKTMTIHNKSGNVSTYMFKDIKINTGLDDKLFVYSK